MRPKSLITCAVCISLFALTKLNAAEQSELHQPSPDWQEQIIYFLMIDRFNDGNPSNNNQGQDEYDQQDGRKFSGGDLPGIEQKINYIKELGATAVWITPPVANQWWSKTSNYGGYHGYWAENLTAVDQHFGTLTDYQNLSRALHRENMYLIQDIVVNHMGNYFAYQSGWQQNNPAAHFELTPETGQGSAPSQYPFNQNDARVAKQRQAAIYHWTPDISDYTNLNQVYNYQMAGLDDLNTENLVVRDALRDSYAYWIKEVGVDAFRVDTALYVPPEYFRDFLYANNAKAPGIFQVAKQTGRQQFHVFGEGFAIDKPFEDTQTKKIQSYTQNPSGQALMPGMLNFPLYGTSVEVFARGHATTELSYRINNMMQTFEQPHLMPSFIDNHDVDRYLVNGNIAGLKQSLLLIMTLPGIPVIYYGTEQGLKEQRASLFKSGYGANGQDHFNQQSEMYRYIQAVSTLRKQHKVLTHGKPTIIKDNASGAGALAYRMDFDDQKAFVLFNTAEHDTLLDNIDTGLPAGTKLSALFSIQPWTQDLVVGKHGRISLALSARSGLVLQANGIQAISKEVNSPKINIGNQTQFTDDFTVSGTSNQPFQLVIDGDLSQAKTIHPKADGTWQTHIDTQSMMDANIKHDLVAWQADQAYASEPLIFQVEKQWTSLVNIDDPKADDVGPNSQYQYPDDASWRDHRQQDIEQINISSAGNNLKIGLTMRSISQFWNPPNGFDHVAFSAFIQLPDTAGGSRVMPLQNAELPQGMRWHYRLRANGWTNSLFHFENASASSEGSIQSTGVKIEADPAARTITWLIPGKAIGKLNSLSGIKIYINTWDYDGGYRPLNTIADTHTYGGGNPNDPKIMDDTVVITLP